MKSWKATLKSATSTLRFRLMIWNAGVVLFASVATLIGLREGVRLALLHEMDQILLEDAQEIGFGAAEVLPTLTDDMRDTINRKARGHQQHGWFARILGADSSEIFASDGAPPRTIKEGTIPNMQPVTRLGLRVVETNLKDAQGNSVRVRVGASLDFLAQDMSRIDRLVIEAVAVVFFAAPLIGYWLAGRTTHTLRQLIGATARLRPTKLAERLPLRNTGDELDQLSRTVNGLLDRIADYLATRRDFLANSAHELRTPVAAIRSTVEVALNADRTKAEYEELLGEVIDECQTLEVLVNQLLLLAETEGERLNNLGERVPLDAIVRNSIDMFRALAESQGVELKLKSCTSCVVEGNRHHLKQVLNNLLDNAIKFTPTGGTITVALERHAQQAVLLVRDTGIGMSEEDLPHIFERFFRCDRSRMKNVEIRGTGLGLSICQAVVQAHGGQITVESDLGEGTCFRVKLPLITAESHRPALDTALTETQSERITSSAANRE